MSVEVLNVTLPAVASWAYHHDQWQNPWSLARYFGVTPWSQAHWNYLRPHLQVASAGRTKGDHHHLDQRPLERADLRSLRYHDYLDQTYQRDMDIRLHGI